MRNHNLPSKQKNYVLALAVIVCVVIYVFIRGESQSDISSVVNPSEVSPQASTLLPVTTHTAIVTKADLKNDLCSLSDKKNPCAVKQNSESVKVDVKNNAWKIGGVKSPIPSIPLNEKIVAYEIVEIDQHPESIPQIGEQVELPMLHGQKVMVDVQSIATSPNGDQSWSGHLQGQGTDYPVIMTYGEHSIFAMITTPEGSYSMVSVDGLGWLYKNPSEFELSAAGSKDYLETNEIL